MQISAEAVLTRPGQQFNEAGKKRTIGGGREYYETCPDFYSLAHYEHQFGLDAAASEHNTKCPLFISKEQNSLSVSWFQLSSTVWLNPPYSRGLGEAFLKKCWEESQAGSTVVALIHTCTDVEWWYDWIWDKAAEVRHIKGRLKFWLPHPDNNGNYGTVSDMPHSLIIYRPRHLLRHTFQYNWDWKSDYYRVFGKLPVRDIKSPEKRIKYYTLADGTRLAA